MSRVPRPFCSAASESSVLHAPLCQPSDSAKGKAAQEAPPSSGETGTSLVTQRESRRDIGPRPHLRGPRHRLSALAQSCVPADPLSTFSASPEAASPSEPPLLTSSRRGGGSPRRPRQPLGRSGRIGVAVARERGPRGDAHHTHQMAVPVRRARLRGRTAAPHCRHKDVFLISDLLNLQ